MNASDNSGQISRQLQALLQSSGSGSTQGAAGPLEEIGSFLDVLGSFSSILGLQAFSLIIITILFLFLFDIVSPLAKGLNYRIGIGFGVIFGLLSGVSFGGLIKYVLFMAVPYLLAHGIMLWLVRRQEKAAGGD